MKKLLLTLSIAAALLSTKQAANAQAAGSVTTYGGASSTLDIETGSTAAEGAETLYIGPGTYTINGTWEIYSKNVVIDPAAIIAGTGSLVFYNPSLAGGTASPTLIEGNASSNAISVNIVNNNTSGIQLTNIDFPTDLTAAGFTNNSASSTVYVGNDLSLGIDGANVTLGTGVVGDLQFTTTATISNYGPNRMIITNNDILSHMAKDAYTGSFTYPVGIAAADYTPAIINNTVNNAMGVSVQNYAASSALVVVGAAGNGMQRIWNIYAGTAAGNSNVSLQHNQGTNQTLFADTASFLTQYSNTIPNTTGDLPLSTNAWQSNNPVAGAAGSVPGSSVMSHVFSIFATSATDATSYFSKSSNLLNPLPVTLVNFTATMQNCSVKLVWTTTDQANLSRFELQRSTGNGSSYTTISTVNAEGSKSIYNYIDNSPAQGTDLYRLKIVDNNSQYTYSNAEAVTANCSGKPIALYPNPTPGNININGLKGDETIQLYDINGQLLMQKKAVSTQQQLDLTSYPNGVFTVMVLNNTERLLVTKVIKNK